MDLEEALTLALSPTSISIFVSLAAASPCGLSSALSAVVLVGIIPVTPVLALAAAGLTDLEVSDPSLRPPLLAAAAAAYLAAAVALSGCRPAFSLATCYASVTASLALTSLFTKVSVHAAGAAGPILAMVEIAGPEWAPALVLLAPIFWARRRSHTPAQLALGALQASAVTALTLLLID